MRGMKQMPSVGGIKAIKSFKMPKAGKFSAGGSTKNVDVTAKKKGK